MPLTNGSGCDASPALLASTPIVPWTRSHMKLSKWQALGNDYLLVEQVELLRPLTPDRVRQLCDYHYGVGSDGLLEVASVDGARAEVRIWNPDGSTAELSGNGVRIVAAWLARRSGAERVALTVGSREVEAAVAADGNIELDVGQVDVGEAETLELGGGRGRRRGKRLVREPGPGSPSRRRPLRRARRRRRSPLDRTGGGDLPRRARLEGVLA